MGRQPTFPIRKQHSIKNRSIKNLVKGLFTDPRRYHHGIKTHGLRSQAGLTLIEIIIVLIILSLIMTFVANKILGAGDKAKADLTKLKMKDVAQSIEQFQLRYNRIPSSLDGLIQCTEQTGMDCVPITNEEALRDAWGNPFEYSTLSSGRAYHLRSMGADGREGGSGIDYDIAIEGP